MYMCMQLYFHTVYNIIYIYIHIDIINPINISIEQKDAFFLGNQPLRCGKPMVIFISCSSFTKRKTCLHYIPSLPKSSNPSWGGVWTVKGLLRRCFWGPNAYLQGIWKTWVHYSSSLFAVVFGVVYSLAGYFKKDSYFSDSKVFFFFAYRCWPPWEDNDDNLRVELKNPHEFYVKSKQPTTQADFNDNVTVRQW